MTKQEFFEKLSSAGSVSSFMEYSVEGLEAKIHKAYPDKFDMGQAAQQKRPKQEKI